MLENQPWTFQYIQTIIFVTYKKIFYFLSLESVLFYACMRVTLQTGSDKIELKSHILFHLQSDFFFQLSRVKTNV